jgi:hypothetical protein
MFLDGKLASRGLSMSFLDVDYHAHHEFSMRRKEFAEWLFCQNELCLWLSSCLALLRLVGVDHRPLFLVYSDVAFFLYGMVGYGRQRIEYT